MNRLIQPAPTGWRYEVGFQNQATTCPLPSTTVSASTLSIPLTETGQALRAVNVNPGTCSIVRAKVIRNSDNFELHRYDVFINNL